jgi:hypothetical protein
MSDFRLPPPCRRDLRRSSGILHSVQWYFCSDVSGQPICPILKGQDLFAFTVILTLPAQRERWPGYRLGSRGTRLYALQEQAMFFFKASSTGSGTHQSSYSKGSGGSFHRDKAAGAWADFHQVRRLRARSFTPPAPSKHPHGVMFNYAQGYLCLLLPQRDFSSVHITSCSQVAR